MGYKPRLGVGQAAKDLFAELAMLQFHGMMFGQQDAPITGCLDATSGWTIKDPIVPDPDVYRVVGQFPAVYGFDLGWLTEPELLALAPLFSSQTEAASIHKAAVEDHHRQGGISTFSWHVANGFNQNLNDLAAGNPPFDGMSVAERIEQAFRLPLPASSGASRADTLPDVVSVTDPPVLHPGLKTKLGIIADFAKSLEVDGKPVPIIFRPYHENNLLDGLNGYFWWDWRGSLDAHYKTLYIETVKHLDSLGAKNILYAFSPNVREDLADFLVDFEKTFPGTDHVDILGIDFYPEKKNRSPRLQAKDLVSQVDELHFLAREHKKLTAITEGGLERLRRVETSGAAAVPVDDYWTEDYLLPLWRSVKNILISYSMIWKNVDPAGEFYGPFPGQSSEADFIKMAGKTANYVGSLKKFRKEVLFRGDARRKRTSLRKWKAENP